MEAIRAKHPKLQTNTDTGKPVTLGEMIGITFAGVPAEHAQEYNEKLEAFYLEHEQYLVRLQDYRNLRALTAELKIMLANEGTCPADDIDVYMHFPDGFRLVNGEDLDEPPEPPKSPRKPATMQELIAGAAAMPAFNYPASLLNPRLPELNVPRFRNISSPSIRRTKSYEVEVGVTKLKHTFNEELDPLYIVFPSFLEASSFSIDYRLHAGNAPDAMTGQLHVIVEKAR
jgi:hypothetical protein